MTRPTQLPKWAADLLKAVFLLAVGGVANQFWLLPIQQQKQDDRLAALEHRMDDSERAMRSFSDQHNLMLRKMDSDSTKLDDLTEKLDNHDRRVRKH
jgi:uncharacterized coiled-coil protein SlyX